MSHDFRGRIAAAARRVPTAAWVAVLYSLLFLVIALPQGLDTPVGFRPQTKLTPLATIDEIASKFDGADAATYARGGREIVAHGGWFEDTRPYTRLWAPGIYYVHALALVLVGESGPAVLAMLVLTCLAWAAVMSLLFVFCRIALPVAVSIVVPLAFPAFPFFRDYFLRDGVISSEPLSTAAWLGALLLLLIGVHRRKPAYAIGAGIVLALAAYLRAQVEIIALTLTVIVVLDAGLVILCGRRACGESFGGAFRALWSRHQWRALVVALLAFHVCTLPYRYYKNSEDGTAMFVMTEYYYKYLWMTPEEYPAVAGFILQGGGPIACNIDRAMCEHLRAIRGNAGEDAISGKQYRRLAALTFWSRPGRWIKTRLKALPRYWFSMPALATPRGRDDFSGYGLAALALLGAAGALALARSPLGFVSLLWFGALLLGHAAIFVFLHFETRYLYLPQTGALAAAIVSVVIWLVARKERAAQRPRELGNEPGRD